MINNILRRLFTPDFPYNHIDRQRVRGLLILTVAVIITMLTRVGFEIRSGTLSGTGVLIPPIIAFTAAGMIYFLVHRGRLMLGAWVLIILLLMGAIILNLSGINQTRVVFLLLPLVVAAGLLNRRGEIALVGVFIFLISVILVTQQTVIGQFVDPRFQSVTPGTDFQIFVTGLLLLLLIVYLLIFPMRETITRTQAQSTSLQKIVDFTATVLDQVETLEAACAETILFLRNKLGYPFAQVFLVGGKGVLNQRVRTGLNADFTTREDIAIGDLSAVQLAVAEKNPILVSNADNPARIGHFLPATKHGICLPVNDHEGVVGVLDVQSSAEPFTYEERTALNAVAAYLGATISDIRLIDALKNNIRQQEEVAEKLRQRIQEMQQNSVITVQQTARQQSQNVTGLDMKGATFTPASSIPENLRPVLKNGALLVQNQDNVKIVNIPINLHGEIVGAMSFTVPKDRVLTERQMETANIVANRLALAIENKRLVEQTRAQAARERKANEAASLLLSATNVDAVMNLAVQTFNEALGAINTRIHLQPAALMETEQRSPEKA